MHERMVEALFRAPDIAGVSYAASRYLAMSHAASSAAIATCSADGTELVLVAGSAVPQSFVAAWGRVNTDSPGALADVCRTGQAHFMVDASEFVLIEDGIASVAMLPLNWPSPHAGALIVGFASQHPFGEEERESLVAAGSLVSRAVELTRMASRDRVAALARQYLDDANASLIEKTAELEFSNRTLQEQAVELEQQTEEAQALTEELEENIEELRASEVRFRALIEVSSQAVWRSNAKGVVQVASPSLAKLTGIDVSTPSRITRERIVHPDDVERSAAVRRWSLEESKTYETEVRIRRPDGTHRWFLERAVPVFDVDGTTLIEWWEASATSMNERWTSRSRNFCST
ncbi:MAG: sensor protein [Gemmatimonadetes bacterium]|nr:sensor protein [Gemmatimonadota bacterium]